MYIETGIHGGEGGSRSEDERKELTEKERKRAQTRNSKRVYELHIAALNRYAGAVQQVAFGAALESRRSHGTPEINTRPMNASNTAP